MSYKSKNCIWYKEHKQFQVNAEKVDELYKRFVNELSPNTVQYYDEITEKYNESVKAYTDFASKIQLVYLTQHFYVVQRINPKDTYKSIFNLYKASKQLVESLLDRLKDILNKHI